MSTVQVANIHFEPTGNNRIQYDGSNVSIYKTGSLILTANSTAMNLSDGISSAIIGNNLPQVDKVEIGQYVLGVNTPNSSFVEANKYLHKLLGLKYQYKKTKNKNKQEEGI